MTKYTKRIGMAIKLARTAIGVSQVEFAKQIGTSKSTLARLETFKASLPAHTLQRSLEVFHSKGVSVDGLVDGPLAITVDEDEINSTEAIE